MVANALGSHVGKSAARRVVEALPPVAQLVQIALDGLGLVGRLWVDVGEATGREADRLLGLNIACGAD